MMDEVWKDVPKRNLEAESQPKPAEPEKQFNSLADIMGVLGQDDTDIKAKALSKLCTIAQQIGKRRALIWGKASRRRGMRWCRA